MPKKQNPEQKEVVGRVMHEFKHGELKSGRGGKVRNPKQAIAIALHEAGSSNQQSPAENKRALARTKQRERRGQTARARTEGGASRKDLYERAKRANIPGRSKMTKEQLERALGQPH
ncbi:MAG: hypothetical protein JO157_18140 [Acetobacteraceae bacterium]|nr:hypothetical protein [Acetobacteraceae bacterium]